MWTTARSELMAQRHCWLVIVIGFSACTTRTIGSQHDPDRTYVRVAGNVKNKVDILFMVDNSPSMTPKQDQLKLRFPRLVDSVMAFATAGYPAWYHIGV